MTQTIIEKAMEMVIMDAIEKGASKDDIIKYMGSTTFETAVKRYAEKLAEIA